MCPRISSPWNELPVLTAEDESDAVPGTCPLALRTGIRQTPRLRSTTIVRPGAGRP